MAFGGDLVEIEGSLHQFETANGRGGACHYQGAPFRQCLRGPYTGDSGGELSRSALVGTKSSTYDIVAANASSRSHSRGHKQKRGATVGGPGTSSALDSIGSQLQYASGGVTYTLHEGHFDSQSSSFSVFMNSELKAITPFDSSSTQFSDCALVNHPDIVPLLNQIPYTIDLTTIEDILAQILYLLGVDLFAVADVRQGHRWHNNPSYEPSQSASQDVTQKSKKRLQTTESHSITAAVTETGSDSPGRPSKSSRPTPSSSRGGGIQKGKAYLEKEKGRAHNQRSGRHNDDDDDDGDEDEDEDEDPRRPHSKNPPYVSDNLFEKVMFCPLYRCKKHVFARYAACAAFRPDMTTLKQHLRENHCKAFLCRICYRDFKDVERLEKHLSEGDCPMPNLADTDSWQSFRSDRLDRLRHLGAKKRNETDDAHWRKLWEIFCPGTEPKPLYVQMDPKESEFSQKVFQSLPQVVWSALVAVPELEDSQKEDVYIKLIDFLREKLFHWFQDHCLNLSPPLGRDSSIQMSTNPGTDTSFSTILDPGPSMALGQTPFYGTTSYDQGQFSTPYYPFFPDIPTTSTGQAPASFAFSSTSQTQASQLEDVGQSLAGWPTSEPLGSEYSHGHRHSHRHSHSLDHSHRMVQGPSRRRGQGNNNDGNVRGSGGGGGGGSSSGAPQYSYYHGS